MFGNGDASTLLEDADGDAIGYWKRFSGRELDCQWKEMFDELRTTFKFARRGGRWGFHHKAVSLQRRLFTTENHINKGFNQTLDPPEDRFHGSMYSRQSILTTK